MSLFLFETTWSLKEQNQEQLEHNLSTLKEGLSKQEDTLIEVQFAKDYSSAFIIVESMDENQAANTIEKNNFKVTLTKEVRLIGEDIEKVKQQNDIVNYLVEWNLPEHLTMEQYLQRKQQNSVHYEEVPEVEFARTYVCEDMTKCLCFYDAPDVGAVKRAREAVKAPIDAITELGNSEKE